MEFNQTVMARRSLRAYEEGKTVEKAQIEELIRFAQMAPSWKNSQTGRYYVVMSPEMLEHARKATGMQDFSGTDSLWNLTPEQMKALRSSLPYIRIYSSQKLCRRPRVQTLFSVFWKKGFVADAPST